MKPTLLSLVALCLCAASASTALADAPERPTTVYDIPRVAATIAPGKTMDWGGAGFRIDIMGRNWVSDYQPPRSEFDGRVRLGWTDQGLLVGVQVRVDRPREATSPDQLWTGDGIELFVSTGWGESQRYQIVISPGADPAQTAPRERLYDHRSAPAPAVGDVVASVKTVEGYESDIRLPWVSLGIDPKMGRELAFNIYVNHADAQGNRAQLAWHLGGKASSDAGQMNRIRLASRPSTSIEELVNVDNEFFRRYSVEVESTSPLPVGAISARIGRMRNVPGTIDPTNPNVATFVAPLPEKDTAGGEAIARIGDRTLAPVPLPDIAAERKEIFDWLKFEASPAVISCSDFPFMGFRDANLAEDVIGRFTVRTTFYDKDFNPVTTAQTPGRYGAVSVVTSSRGFTKTYYTTLYRSKSAINWRDPDLKISLSLPASFGPDPAVIASRPNAISDGLRNVFLRACVKNRKGL